MPALPNGIFVWYRHVYGRRQRWAFLEARSQALLLALSVSPRGPDDRGFFARARSNAFFGIHPDHISVLPNAVDNDWWIDQASRVNRDAVRASWGANAETAVILFCAKLQPWKRPADLLRAFARANLPGSLLVYAGEGALRQELEAEASRLGISQSVRFLGFVNQTKLPAVYRASDLMVLPSEYEPFALVVNEAYCCGCPVVVSDQVGAAQDLVEPVDPELVYPCGNEIALSALLKELSGDKSRLRRLGSAATARIKGWSGADMVESTVQAVTAAVRHRHR